MERGISPWDSTLAHQICDVDKRRSEWGDDEMLKRSGTYVTQSGDGTHGEQHVAWFVQQPGSNKVAVDPYSGDEGQSDDPLQSDGL